MKQSMPPSHRYPYPSKGGTFNDAKIRRTGLPQDVFALLHDLCYDHSGRDREQYKRRAQEILMKKGEA